MQQYRLARDDNHNDRTQHTANLLAKESGLAALEAFQREYLPSMARHSLPSIPSSPPPAISPALPSTESFHQQNNATFDEQYKDVSSLIKKETIFNFSIFQLYEIDDNPNRKIWLDKLFSFMQNRGEFF